MPYTIRENKSYEAAPDAVFRATLGAVEGLGGKVESKDSAGGAVQILFDKKILGKVLGDRTRVHVQVNGAGDNSELALEAYPVDAIGRKLQFGARKGVTQQVVSWFFAHVEHRLK